MNKKQMLLYVCVLGLVVATDLWSKVAVFDMLGANAADPDSMRNLPEITIIPGCFNLQAAFNPGAFNGWFANQRVLLLGVAGLWVVGTFIYVAIHKHRQKLLTIGLAMTAGGAFGNVWDRYFFSGVRDFVKWYVAIDGRERVWPNFNIADSCILIGVGLILIRELLTNAKSEHDSEPTHSESAELIQSGAASDRATADESSGN